MVILQEIIANIPYMALVWISTQMAYSLDHEDVFNHVRNDFMWSMSSTWIFNRHLPFINVTPLGCTIHWTGSHYRFGLGGDTGVRVNLLQHLVDVDGVRLPPPLPALLVPIPMLYLEEHWPCSSGIALYCSDEETVTPSFIPHVLLSTDIYLWV